MERLQAYVDCSLANLTTSAVGSQVVVLFFTDESDSSYLEGVHHLFDAWGDLVLTVHVDTWLKDQLSTNDIDWPASYDNNFHFILLLYSFLDRLPRRFAWVHRRNIQCDDCVVSWPPSVATPLQQEKVNPLRLVTDYFGGRRGL